MHDPAPQPKPVVFVARRWDPQEDTLNTRLISLMERAGFTVSTKMDRAVVNNLEHKETVNIIDADAFCLIMTPRSETDTVSLNIQVEIGVAKAFEIPAFVLVDKAHMGGPSLSGTVRAITHGLNNGHTWYEFSRHTLLSGAEDEKLLDFLRSARIAVNDTAPRKREARLLALAALFAKDDRMEPFQNGLRIVANAYDNSSPTLYDAIARAAVSITGAEFGFVGLLEQDHTWTQISASGFIAELGEERGRPSAQNSASTQMAPLWAYLVTLHLQASRLSRDLYRLINML